MSSPTTVWIVIVAMAIGSFALRFSFLGLIGGRPMPEWILRHLRYAAVAVLPGLVAPLILWPAATGGELDPARLFAAGMTLAVGLVTRNVLAAMGAGAVALYATMGVLALAGS